MTTSTLLPKPPVAVRIRTAESQTRFFYDQADICRARGHFGQADELDAVGDQWARRAELLQEGFGDESHEVERLLRSARFFERLAKSMRRINYPGLAEEFARSAAALRSSVAEINRELAI